MKAVIFDLDGTLWDTSDAVVKKWNEVLREESINLKMTKEIMASLMGKNEDEIIDSFFSKLEKTHAKRVISRIFLSEQEYLRRCGANMYDSVIDTLNILKKKYSVIIVSNCQNGYINSFIEYYNLKEVLSDFECAGNTGLSKGENIKLTLKRNNIEKAIYVGDTKSDELAANYANLPFVFASYGFGVSDKFDAVINSFDEIINVADKLL
ncbi:MAG: HAD family hydrolase [Ruminococcus sp.]|nr:HAD family hydrolase [Ruminococcus sp.]